MEIPIQKLEEIGRDMRETYYIPCTYPHPRMKHQTFKTPNYVQCKSTDYKVKWNPSQQEAKVFCKNCAGELFSHQLNMSPQIGGNTNGTIDNTNNDTDNRNAINTDSGDSTHTSSQEIDANAREIK